MYSIEYAKGVAGDLAALRAYERSQILDRIEEQLTHNPTQQTRNKKILVGLIPPWEHVQPVWELRVGEYRVFYDVDEGASSVIIRAIRQAAAQNDGGNIMKIIGLEQASLDTCVKDAQRERVVITQNGKPVVLIVGVEGMDEEQLELSSSDKFWRLIAERRAQKTVSRAELEQNVGSSR